MVERYFCRTITLAYKHLSWRETFWGGGILRGDSSWSGWDDIFLCLFVYGRELFYMAEGKQRNLFICRTIFRGERKNVMIVPRFVTTFSVR